MHERTAKYWKMLTRGLSVKTKRFRGEEVTCMNKSSLSTLNHHHKSSITQISQILTAMTSSCLDGSSLTKISGQNVHMLTDGSLEMLGHEHSHDNIHFLLRQKNSLHSHKNRGLQHNFEQRIPL